MKKTNKFYILFLISFLLFFFGTNSKADALSSNIPQAPSENIFVQDYANIIDDSNKAQLLQMSENARSNGTAELAIVTIPSLNGDDIKAYANTLFRTWGIGNKETNNGLLVLIVNDTRQTRIEVGKGLEGNITDAKAGDVIRTMAPYFKENKFGEGLIVGHKNLENMISQKTTESTITNSSNSVITNSSNSTITATNTNKEEGVSTSTIVIIVLVVLLVIYLCSRRPSRRRYRGGSSYYSSSSYDDSSSSYGGGSDSFGGGSSDGGGADGGW